MAEDVDIGDRVAILVSPTTSGESAVVACGTVIGVTPLDRTSNAAQLIAVFPRGAGSPSPAVRAALLIEWPELTWAVSETSRRLVSFGVDTSFLAVELDAAVPATG
jgi:hypothetical protein